MEGKEDQESFRKYLSERRQIFLSGKIDKAQEYYICHTVSQLRGMSTGLITLFIDSNGGYTEHALRIYRKILSVGNVIGFVIGEASSGAAIILQACGQRKALRRKDVYVFIHDPSIIHEKDKQNTRICALLTKQQALMYDILSKRSGRSIDEVTALCRNNARMDVQEALRLGFIDEIVDDPSVS